MFIDGIHGIMLEGLVHLGHGEQYSLGGVDEGK